MRGKEFALICKLLSDGEILIKEVNVAAPIFLKGTQVYYPGPRGFLLFFIGTFCDANRFLNFFYWQEALRAEKRKPLVATVGNLTSMPSAFDRRF